MPNLLSEFRSLLPDSPLLAGEVTAIDGGQITVTLPDGGVLTARGVASMGQIVFVRDGVIEGLAGDLTVVEIEI